MPRTKTTATKSKSATKKVTTSTKNEAPVAKTNSKSTTASPALIAESMKRISKCRSKMLITKPFWGYLALSLKPVAKTGLDFGTMATDGYNLYFDPVGAMKDWSDDELIGAMTHEVGHCAFGHMWRRENRIPLLWNIATDYAVNWILDKEGITLPKDILLDKNGDFSNKSAEYIYKELLKQQEEHQKNCPVCQQKGGHGGNSPDGDSEGEDSNDGGQGSSGGQGHCGHSPHHGKHTLDDSTIWNDTSSKKGNNKQDKDNQDGQGNSSEQDAEEREKYWKDKVRGAAITAKMEGKLPAYMEQFIDEFLAPKLSWKELLRDLITTSHVNDYKIMPPNKKFLYMPVYLPSMKSNHLDLAVCMDTSGSISDRVAKQFLSEIKSIADSFESYSIHYMQCDYDISFYQELLKENEDDWPMNVVGRGGTSFVPPFNYMEDELGIEPPLFVYLTDLMGQFPQVPPNYPVLWVSIEDRIEPPFGEKIHIDVEY